MASCSKISNVLSGLILCGMVSFAAANGLCDSGNSIKEYEFFWRGQFAGFVVNGRFQFDVHDVPANGIVREENLQTLDVSFYAPNGTLLRTYQDNHREPTDENGVPYLNFAFDVHAEEIFQDGRWDVDDHELKHRNGFLMGEGKPSKRNEHKSQKGLAFWSRPGDDKDPHLHVDDWNNQDGVGIFEFPAAYGSHEDASFPYRTTAQKIAGGKVSADYYQKVNGTVTVNRLASDMDSFGQVLRVRPAYHQTMECMRKEIMRNLETSAASTTSMGSAREKLDRTTDSLKAPPSFSNEKSTASGIDFDPNVTEYWFDTVVDHFNFRPTAEATFPLRYFVNDQYYANSSSPVIFYAGNEAPILQFLENSGFLWEAAEKLNAMVVFAEHRYYGESFPFGSPEAALTPQNISYLSVEQAMADFNTLQVEIRKKWGMSRDAAFIVTGGSYGGNLALWLRLKNPNLWAGALASSATPLKHLLRESNAFSRIVADVYGNVSAVCPDKIRNGWKDLFQYTKSEEGRKNIQIEMNLCHVPTPEEQPPEDVANEIYGWISGALETMVQYGYPYPTEFYNPVPGYPFKVACENMLQEKTALGSLRVAAQVYYNYTGQAGSCFDWFSLSSPPSHATNGFGKRGVPRSKLRNFLEDDLVGIAWGYQLCTEVYQPMPTDGITDIELPYQPNKEEYFQGCRERWDGVTPRPDWEEMTFMSDNIQGGSNVFLTSGQLDPWRAAGIQSLPRNANQESIIVRIIENGAHHLDLRSSHPLDPPSVSNVRHEELATFERWIKQWREMYPSTDPEQIPSQGLRGKIAS